MSPIYLQVHGERHTENVECSPHEQVLGARPTLDQD